jgi:hypothetical protein
MYTLSLALVQKLGPVCHPQGLMNATQIVVHEVERDCREGDFLASRRTHLLTD